MINDVKLSKTIGEYSMKTEMFCFQCEQTAKGTGCTGAAGVCGKKSDTANLQDKLTGALIAMAKVAIANPSSITSDTDNLMLLSLFSTVTNVSFDNVSLQHLLDEVHVETQRMGAGKAGEDYDMVQVWEGNEDIRSLKSLILFGIRGVAAYAWHARNLGHTDSMVNRFFYEALVSVGSNDGMDKLLPMVLKVGEVNLSCMALLDKANTQAYGHPVPTTVSMTIEKGPFIVVTGHDLFDLKKLLEQTEGKGINIYTHGEMLPAHAYPNLKKYSHLKGHFGTAWQNQQKEFDDIPAPVLYTTNCLMPPKGSYQDRIFTSDAVAWPGATHIGPNRDFTAVIDKALELGGYACEKVCTGMNGGSSLMTGFGHNTVLGAAKTVIDAVKGGALKRIFLVGGCDGAKSGRNYYTEFVQKTPKDTLVLTLACGKFRFNDLNIGTLGGLPRLLDMGQCNDAYSALKVALALADAFGCTVNDLPLSLVLSWYEQKAVCILLTLLHLGVKNILIGPSLPAFVSQNVLKVLVENYNIAPISTPEADLAKLLG